MDTMEITKIVGAVCGSLLIFLLIRFGAEMIYDTHSEVTAFIIETDEGQAPAEEPDEVIDVAALLANADASAGQGIFRRCASCHRVDGSDAAGPHLDGVVGRDKASVAGFSYSPGISSLPGTWTVDDLFHFLEKPAAFAPGTTMNFAGISRQSDLADLIAYLQSVSN